MKANKFFTFALFCLLMASATAAFAQSDRGNITGTVKDPSGALVPNAKVTATDLSTNETRDTTTTAEGNYTLSELKADPYRLTVEAQGFKTATIENIQVAVQVTRHADVTLEIGAVTDVVTVAQDATVLQTDTPVRQTNVTEQQVKELPLQVGSEFAGRTPLSFIFLDSTVTAANYSSTQSGTDATNFRVNGGQGLGTEILIDGAATRRAQNGTFFSEVAPGPNAYQEFTVSTSNYSAEFGNSSGGIVNFTLKSGSNDLHGEVYDLFRNNALEANTFTNNSIGQAINRDHQHDFGGNVGGPIFLPRFGEGGKPYKGFKNRAFFFFNFESYHFAQGENVVLSVPTAQMRMGDFSQLLTDPTLLRVNGGPIQLYSPIAGFDARGNPISAPQGTRVPIPGDRIDLFRLPTGQSIIDPVGQAILQYFPLPNLPGVYRNYQTTTQIPTVMNSPTFKIDLGLSEKNHLSFSFSYRNNTRIAGGAPRYPEPDIALGRWQQFFKSQFYRLQDDYTISPKLLNHLNIGFTRYVVANHNTTLGFNEVAQLGFLPTSVANLAFPEIDFPGYGDPADPGNLRAQAYQGIGSTFFSDQEEDNTVELSDFLTYVHGRHTMKFGADVRIQQFNVNQLLYPGGQFNFRSPQTAQNCDCNSQGFPIASLLVGATEFSFNAEQTAQPAWRQLTHSYFFQDDIKVTPRLTVNAGIRYDLPGLRREGRDIFRGFDPNTPNPAAGGRLGAIVGAGGQGGLQAQYETLAKPDYSNIGPRLGFAYSLNDRTVVRGGIGLYYAPIIYGFNGANSLTEGTIGYNTPIGANFTSDNNSDLFLRDYRALPPIDPNGQFIGSDVDYFDKNFKTGRTLQFGLDVQRELPYHLALTLSYTGSRGTRLRSDFNRINALPFNDLRLGNALLNENINNVSPAERAYAQSLGITIPASGNAVYPGFNGSVGQALKPYPQYGYIQNILESQGRSWYNAGTAKLERRFAQGIQFGVSYTFSKLITNASEDLFGGSAISSLVQIPGDSRDLRTVSPNNAAHVIVFNYILEVPFGKGKRFFNHGGWTDRLLGGWQIDGIQRYQSGLPLVIRWTGQGAFGTDSVTGYNTDIRPNLTGQPILTGNSLTGNSVHLVNPAAFTTPPCFDCGSVPAEFTAGGAINPAYIAYYSDPTRFFGNAPAVINQRVLPFLSENISLLKKTRLTERFTMELGAEAFNVFNRHRFNFPDSNLNDLGNNFGISTVVSDPNLYAPRVIQIRVRFIY